jgi:hypothetical protein
MGTVHHLPLPSHSDDDGVALLAGRPRLERLLTHLTWPTATLRSLEENWQWLAALLRSRLTSSTRAV